MAKVERLLFYLLILFLPIQLGRHFFFDFSFTSGIRSDYLTPTLYLSDLIIIFLILLRIIEMIKDAGKFKAPISKLQKIIKSGKFWMWSLIIFYLLFNSIFIAVNKWAAFYKLAKVIEFILLGYAIVKIRPNFLRLIFFLSFDVIYLSVITVWQFFAQKSIGGLWWFLGERTFYASTPAIAKVTFPGGMQILRPYATFPHPNVLGGFLAVVLLLIFYVLRNHKKDIKSPILYRFFKLSFFCGLLSLLLSFSKASWLVAVCGILLVIFRAERKISAGFRKNFNYFIAIFYIFLLTSVLAPGILSDLGWRSKSLKERSSLIVGAIELCIQNPLFGTGLNNFVIQIRNYLPAVSDLYIFQPVHNIYLLVFAETGLVGFLILLVGLVLIFRKGARNSPFATIALLQLYILGLFDHYLFTLQQGMLLFTLFASLGLSKCCNGSNIKIS